MERKIYLLIILALVSVMSYEFNFFSRHYLALEKLNDYVMGHCHVK